MDGSENLAGASENLTSTTMGSVLVRNMNDSENAANDSLPSSSSDANTAAAAVVTQDDPISSTSEEVVAYKKQVFFQQSDSHIDIQMDPETAQIAQQLDITIAKDNNQTNNFEDIASELENLLEESAGDYKSSSKSNKNSSSLDPKDINLDWDIDCEYSLPSKNLKLLDNDNSVPSDKANLETPTSSGEILEGTNKFDTKSALKSSEAKEISQNDIVERINTSVNKTTDLITDEENTSKLENESSLDNNKTVNSIDLETPGHSQSNETNEHSNEDNTEILLLEHQSSSAPDLETLNQQILETNELKEVVEMAPNDAIVKIKHTEAPLDIQMEILENSDMLFSKEDPDTVNGAIDSFQRSKPTVNENISHIETKIIVPEEDSNIRREKSPKLETGTISCDSIPSEIANEEEVENSGKIEEQKQETTENDTIIDTSTPSIVLLESTEANVSNLDTMTASGLESTSSESLENISPSSSALETGAEELTKPVEIITTNLDTITTSAMETVGSEVLDGNALDQHSILEMVPKELETASKISEQSISNLDSMTATAMGTVSSDFLDDGSVPSSESEIILEGSTTTKPVDVKSSSVDTPTTLASVPLEVLNSSTPPQPALDISQEESGTCLKDLHSTHTSATETVSAESLEAGSMQSSAQEIIAEESTSSPKSIEVNTPELDTTIISAEETASVEYTDDCSVPTDITTETLSSELEIELSKPLIIEPAFTSIEIASENAAESFVIEKVTDIGNVENHDNLTTSIVSTISVDSFVESNLVESTPSTTNSTLPSTDTASNSSAVILTNTNTQEVDLPLEAVIEEYVEPSDQPSYEEEIYQSQDLVQDEEQYSQEQSFDSYEEQEEDTLESALIKAAVDAEHTRREITAKKQKEKEEEQAKLREQAERMRKQREKMRLKAERARKLLEEEEQRERDLLNRQIEEQEKLKEEKRLAEVKLMEQKQMALEKKLADEQKCIEEQKLAQEIKLNEKIEAEKTKMALEAIAEEGSAPERDLPLIKTEVAAKSIVTEIAAKNIVTEVASQESQILKPLNIEVEEQCEPSNITRDVESSTKDGNNSEQPSESEEDNKPEYSSKMSQESLKMTITKNKTDELDNILKVYDPIEEDQTIRKLKIKPVLEENVKITFKNLHEKIPHSPKRSLRNLSPNRPQSPKVTIKPIKQESPLKITIKNVGRKSEEIEPAQVSPKITIKHLLNPDEETILGCKTKNIHKEEEEERLHSPKTYKNDSERSSSPKVTIKPVVKSDNTEIVPKLNIRLNKREQSPKHPLKNMKREDENIVEPLKLNIKQYSKDPSSVSPKITFKPVVRPSCQENVHESDDDHAMQERIVLKINKSNYQVDSPQTKKREASEDIEKLAKIKLKVSKKPGHAHIVNEEMEALKRSLPEGIELVDIKKSKLNIPTHSQGATITPIVMDEPVSQQEELSSDSVIFVGESDIALPSHDELIVTPVKSSSHIATPVTTPPPKRRGRPRKVPLEPRDIPVEEPSPATSSDNILMITPNSNMSLHDGGHFLLSPTGSTSGGASPSPEVLETLSSGRPKRSCRGPSAHTQLGIKPRKPRGAVRARGGRGRGHRGGLRGGGVDKPGKFERIPEPKLRLLKETALSMKITDAFDRQDIAIRIVEGVQEQCNILTAGRRRGGGHDHDSDDDNGGTIISTGGGLEIIPRYGTLEEDEPMEMGTNEPMPIKHGPPGKGRIGFLASGVIDITADDSEPPPEDEDDDDEMTGVEEVASSSSPPPSCALDRQLKIVIGRNDQIGHELILNKDIVIYEEETRMSADNGSRSGTPGKQVSPAVDPLADIVDMAMPCEDTQSSVQSSATTESAKVAAGAEASASKTTTRRTFTRGDLSQDVDSLVAITSPEQLAEYHWQGDGPFMLQEQIAEYLGVKSFKRKYPHINRRAVDMQERDYIRDNCLASEAMCNLGLTVLNSADVLDIMYSDFQVKYEEYCKHRRDKEAKEIMNRQRAINLAASQEKTKQDLVQTAISSAAQWNARFNRTRREQRPACMDLQTFTINYAKGSRKVISRGRVGHYPLALVPGQYTDYYQTYTPTEINNLPFNTILNTPLSATGDDDDSDSESDSSGGSDSGSDSSSGSSGSSSSSSSDDEDNIAGKGQISPLNARSPVAAPSGKRLLAAA